VDVTLQGVDLYAVLGIDSNATSAEIKKAYRDKSFQLHPDHGGNAAEFATLSLAYNKLMDPDERAYFDRTGQVKEQYNLEQDAWSLLGTVFKGIVDGAGEGIFNLDVIAEMQNHLQKPIKQGHNRIRGDKVKIEFLERVKAKIVRLDESTPPAFEIVIEEQIRERVKSIADSEDAIEIAELAKKLLVKYQFENKPEAIWSLGQGRYSGGYNPTTVTHPEFCSDDFK